MNALSAALAALLAAAPAFAAAPSVAEQAALRRAADRVLAMSDDAFRELDAQAPADASWKTMDRAAAAETAYRSLAAARYKQALAAGLPGDLDAQARAALDKMAPQGSAGTPSAGLIENTGWWQDFNAWAQPQPTYQPQAVAAVRGGREVSAGSDPAIAKLLSSADASERNLGDEGLTPVKRAQTLLDTARDYAAVADRLAAASAATPAAASTQTATAAPAPAPAAPVLTASEIYRKDAPSVVVILAARDSGRGELGTGSVIAGDRVLTNAHVVVDDATGVPYPRIRVYLKPAQVTGDPARDLKDPITATVARYDRALDLAVLSLSRAPGVAPLALGGDASVQPGDPVVAIGHPEQGGLWTLTKGVVSTVVADLGGVRGKDVFQTDASINRGNSGGPLIAADGEIVGVNTSMARKAADGLTITSVNFSIKSDVVQRWLGESAPAVASAPAGTPASPAASVAAAPAAAPAAPAPAPAVPDLPAPNTKPVMVTPAKPYDIDDVLAAEMKEMDEMGEEMHREIQKRAAEQANP